MRPLQAPRTLAIAAVLGAMAMVVLDAGVVAVALPTIAGAFAASPAQAMAVVTAYQTALVIALLPSGALGERLGHRRVFAGGVAVFALASALCAGAPSLPSLAAARALQGLGGSAVMALGVALLRQSVPDARLGAAIGWNATTVALTSAAAPSLGALIVTSAPWPWLFALNLPLGAAILLAARALPKPEGSARPLDVVSMVLNGGLFGGFVLGVQLAPKSLAEAGAVLALAVGCLALLIRREAPRPAPLFPLDLLRTPSLRISAMASVCCFAGQSAGLLALPFHLQHNLGLTPAAAGLYLTAWPLSVAAAALAAGRLADRLPAAWLCAGGAGLLSAGLIAAAAWPPWGDATALIGFGALCGLGFGLFQTPNNRTIFLSAPATRSGAAGGLQGTARLTGQTAGALMLSTLFSLGPVDAAPRTGMALAAALALAAGLVSLAGRPRAADLPSATPQSP
ncbi:MAG: MFS transporter [Phenylobacterium sp.]|uniref:MFS transporter n=1 Tax=Phenylobacterium sp. TaxID=1871053 RepID=UPI00391A7F30